MNYICTVSICFICCILVLSLHSSRLRVFPESRFAEAFPDRPDLHEFTSALAQVLGSAGSGMELGPPSHAKSTSIGNVLSPSLWRPFPAQRILVTCTDSCTEPGRFHLFGELQCPFLEGANGPKEPISHSILLYTSL